MGENSFHEHFDDHRLPRTPRSGRRSPTSHSDHGSLIRTSLLRVSEGKRAKKVRFYRNGDRFFKGMVYAVSPERFRTFESLMAELTSSPVCDKNAMPQGVRHMFTVDGSRKITALEELEEGESYVCASTDVFRRMDYSRACSSPNWNQNRRAVSRETLPPLGTNGAGSESTRSASRERVDEEIRDYIRPKLITVIRNGSKPRKAVRVLLNRKTAHSFDQVLTDITEAIKLDSGAVRRVYTVDGRQVTCLADFFQDDAIFIAYGQERMTADDFDLVDSEVRHVSAYRAASGKPRDRVTLRSPKSARRFTTSTSRESLNGTVSPKSGLSPKTPRKFKTVSAPKYRQQNGHGSTAPPSVSGDSHIADEEASGVPLSFQERYEIGQVIGEGNFALVKECVDKTTGRHYALKIIDKSKCKGKEQAVASEVSILRRVKHPNIVQLVEDLDRPDALYLVMDLVKGGDLFEAISSATQYTERDASGMVYNLVSALKYLHGMAIVHRDVKPENILVCDHGDGSQSLMLGDFGLATEVDDVLYTVCGTPTYVAPEVIAEVGYGVKIDVWSAGVITYILLCGFPPFVSPTDNQDELFDLIMQGQVDFPSPFWDHVSDAAKDLILGMLEVDPQNRLSAVDVVQHPWVAEDVANSEDLQQNVTQQLQTGAQLRTKRKPGPAGVRLITTTALDKGSRFFQGRGNAPLTLHPRGGDESEEDEIF
ncbi:serine/threonine-protein kinase DCLK1-like [Babylonia areolata]|uniref:serine/threonine-protein kinase DCLK1-like n=1 Tax=Babylonia areolata TaxID=304850 RepID=UPI003FD26AC4